MSDIDVIGQMSGLDEDTGPVADADVVPQEEVVPEETPVVEEVVEEAAPSMIEDPASLSGFRAMTNANEHRCAFINPHGRMTIMDDETAAMFYDNPSFYSYVYDEGEGKHLHVSFLRWCDRNGKPTGGFVGQRYKDAENG